MRLGESRDVTLASIISTPYWKFRGALARAVVLVECDGAISGGMHSIISHVCCSLCVVVCVCKLYGNIMPFFQQLSTLVNLTATPY